MDDAIEAAVGRVIHAMREKLGEQITINDMARIAMFSKFHFSRIFLRVTGISPGRFLSALRLQEAKRLLLSSPKSVADISHLVGYNSIGTFSSRFRASVGVSPSEYRQYGGFVAALPPTKPDRVLRPGVARGNIWSTPGCRPGRVVIGLFPGRIAQGFPVCHTTRSGSGPFELGDVPAGTWHVLARSLEVLDDERGVGQPYVAAFGPIDISPDGTGPGGFDMWLRPQLIFDPPTLLVHLDRRMMTTSAWVPADLAETTLSRA